MFDAIKVKDVKGLKEATLTGLGRVNVICGRNNSGKSTILEAVNDPKHRSRGKALGVPDIQRLADDVTASPGWKGYEAPNAMVRAQIERLCQSKELWYADESKLFVPNLVARCREIPELERWDLTAEVPMRAFTTVLGEDDETVLVPAMRRMEFNLSVVADHAVNPNGSGLAKYLFFAKNQAEESEARRTLHEIETAFGSITDGYRFDVIMDSTNTIELQFGQGNTARWFPAGSCGLGLQDLLVILYFAVDPEYGVVLIEEPESHIHPDMQRKLLSFLRYGTSKQFILSTHSNVFVNNALVDRVFLTRFEESVVVDDATSRASMLDDLGYSVTDNLVSDLIILVEGPKDVPVIEEFLVKMEALATYSIKIWPLGGDIMDQTDLSVFAEKYAIVALVDNDPGSEHVRRRFIENCNAFSIPVTRLKRYAMENYFTFDALRMVFKGQIPDTLTSIDPNRSLEDQIGMNVKRSNRKIAQAMTREDVQNTDDLYVFLSDVKRRCEESVGSTRTPSGA